MDYSLHYGGIRDRERVLRWNAEVVAGCGNLVRNGHIRLECRPEIRLSCGVFELDHSVDAERQPDG